MFFLLPLGGDTEYAKPPGTSSSEAHEIVEVWSVGTLLVWGSLGDESHLTFETVAAGILSTSAIGLVCFGLCRLGKRRAAHSHD